MGIERVIILALVASGLISMAYAIAGTATFYTVYVPSSCYGYEPQGTMIVAANPKLFDKKAACGKMCKVRCTGPTNQGILKPCRNGEIKVKIVDLCRGCGDNQLDLSKEAFSLIANPDAGRIKIDYSCS